MRADLLTCAGGLSFLIKYTFNYQIRDDLKISVPTCENLGLKSINQTKKALLIGVVYRHPQHDHNYYVYMVSFALSRYRIWITSGLFLNVICWVSALIKPMRWPPRQEDVSLWSVRGLVCAVLGWHLARLAFSACLQIRYDCTVIHISVLSSVLEVWYQHNYQSTRHVGEDG